MSSSPSGQSKNFDDPMSESSSTLKVSNFQLSDDIVSSDSSDDVQSDTRLADPIAILSQYEHGFKIGDEIKEHADRLMSNASVREVAATMGYDTSNYEYMIMGGLLLMKDACSKAAKNIKEYVKIMDHRLCKEIGSFMRNNAKRLQADLDKYDWCNYRHDYASASVMVETYLARPRKGDPPAETPCLMYMRVAVQERHNDGIDSVIRCYRDYAKGYATPASPQLFNAGFINPQMSSCFVFSVGDNMHSIQMTNYVIGMVSANGGGLGGDVSEVRAKGSTIRHIGESKGIIPINKMYAENVKYVRQGLQRNGAMTMSNRPHHRDIFDFISLLDNVGDHNARTPDLNIALWTSWLFWDRVREEGDWSLFCPHDTPQLNRVYGMEFKKRYIEAEKDLRIPRKTVKAMDLLKHMIKIQKISGKPYVAHGDSANFKSPHNHIGYIRSSNLCMEIIEYTDEDNINVCNLKSINLGSMVKGRYVIPPRSLTEVLQRMNMKKLAMISRHLVVYLNRIIDNNFYPLDTDDGVNLRRGPIHKTNMRFRALGIGVSGEAELFASLDLAYTSEIAGELDKIVFACIYFNTLASSVQMSILEGKNEIFDGSSYSKGKLQFDLWQEEYLLRWCTNNDPNTSVNPVLDFDSLKPKNPIDWNQEGINLYNRFGEIIDTILPTWDDLKRVIMKYGMRNSLLIALMPTASTAKTFRNSESCEPHIGNIYSTKLLAGSYPVMNRFMYYDLRDIGLWGSDVREYIIANDGKLTGVSKYLLSKEINMSSDVLTRLRYLETKYLTMYEINQQLILFRATMRGIYVDQSQSTSVFIEEPDDEKLIALHLLTDMLGLKTGMYYLRTRASAETSKFTIDPAIEESIKRMNGEKDGESEEEFEVHDGPVFADNSSFNSNTNMVCTMQEGCLMCGS